jgi:succinoglycan biosynthesis protein ExoA
MILSIIIPCYNESLYLAPCLNSLLENDFSYEDLEILIIDGGSTDGTIAIVESYIENYSFIKLIYNKKKLKPIALNIGIKASKGDVVMRIDAHATYNKDYIRKLVNGLYSENVDNIGGVRDTYIPIKGTSMEIALSEAISHPLVVGNAYYRTSVLQSKQLVDTVFCGCYRREVFEKIGLFNEHLIRTQDREFNLRLIDSGGKIMLDPDVRCMYYSRIKLIEYIKWNWKGAEWLGGAKQFTSSKMLSLRNYLPSVFAFYIIIITLFYIFCIVNSVHYEREVLLLLPLVVYLALLVKASVSMAIKHSKLGLFFVFPMVAFLTHTSYGLALLWGRVRSW